MTDRQIVAGDVVRLKSGGADMTVAHTKHGETAWCEWHDDQKQPHESNFHLTTLVLVAPQTSATKAR